MMKFTKLFLGFAIATGFFLANAFGQNAVQSFTVENGTYFPGDPVMMSVTVANTADAPGGDADYFLDIHLTPGPPRDNFRQSSDHMLQTFSGSLFPEQQHVYEWVQYMPGNLTGEFYVTFEIYGDIGDQVPDITHSSSVNIVLQSEGTGRFPTTSLFSRSFGAPDIADENFDFNASGGVFSTDGNSETPSVSADGRFVVYASTATNLTPAETIVDGDEVITATPSGNVFDIYLQDRREGTVTLVSRPGGAFDFSNGNSLNPRISPDGRFVVFHSTASNLVTGSDNTHSDVYAYDRLSASLQRISMGSGGEAANGPSFNASISDPDPVNGHRYIAFESEASNLLPAGQDTNNLADVYLYNLNTGAIRRVNVADQGAQASGGHSRNPVISADARHIAFQSRATNLGSPTSGWDVFVHDRDSNQSGTFDESGGIRTLPVSVGGDGSGGTFAADGHSHSPAITPDGRFIAFVSEAFNLFNRPATGSVTLSGRPEQVRLEFPETVPATGVLRFSPDVDATGRISFLDNPIPNENNRRTLTLNDGSNAITFEFSNAAVQGYQVGDGNQRLVVGSSENATRNKLRDAINASPLSINAVADTFLIGEEGEEEEVPGLLLTNFGQGEAGNQEIETANVNGVIVTEGMAGAEVGNVAPGDRLFIETIPGFESVFTFVEDAPQAPNEVQVGPTAEITRDNIANTIQGLMALDFPDISNPTALGTFLVGPFADNPEAGDVYTFEHQGSSQTFGFVEEGIQFNPNLGPSPLPIPIVVGPSLDVTRGNVVRYINAFFDFEDIPEGVGGDTTATGSVSLRVNPEEDDGASVSIGPATFAFVEEFEEDEDDPDFDFEEEVIDDRDPFNVLIVIGEDLEESQERLLEAVQGSPLNLTAAEGTDEDGEPAILLIFNEVGPAGNLPFAFTPEVEEPDDPDDEPEPAVFVMFPEEGMEGGALMNVDPGSTHVLYEHGILHPAITLEFSPDGTVGANNLEVPMVESGDETLGNFLERVRTLALPRVTVSTADLNGPELRINNLIPGGFDHIVLTIDFEGNPDVFQEITFQDGEIRIPREGARLTVDDTESSAIFEFDQDGVVGPGVIPVPVGQNAADTRDYLIRAIRESGLNVTATDTTAEHPAVTVANNRRGAIPDPNHVLLIAEDLPSGLDEFEIIEGQNNPTAGESFTLSDGDIARTFEFVELEDENGENGDEGDEEEEDMENGNIPVFLGPDDQRSITFENLIDAIRDSDLRMTAIPATANGAPSVSLTNWQPGPIGNVPIVTSPPTLPSFEVTGMAGGGFEGTGMPQVYVHDRDANDSGVYDEAVMGGFATEAISLTPLDTFALGGSHEPAISADGRYVSFRSFGLGQNVQLQVPEDPDDLQDLLDQLDLLDAGLQPLVVERSDGTLFPNVPGPVLVTEFGPPIETTDDDNPIVFSQEVFYQDRIQNFTAVGSFSDIYVRDRETGINERVSVNRFGEVAGTADLGTLNVPSSDRNAVMSADGRYVIFTSDNGPFTFRSAPAPQPNAGDEGFRAGGLSSGMTNRNPLNNNGFRNIFIHDRKFPTGDFDPDPAFPPRVTLQEPVDGAHLSLGVTHELRASAFPNSAHGSATIEVVDFIVNGTVVGTDATSPYTAEWEPDSTGDFVISARARDSLGNVSTSIANVVVTDFSPFSHSSDFVRDVYQRMLGRAPGSTELADATIRLDDGRLSRQRLVASLMNSVEFDHVLVNAYTAHWVVFGRAPTDRFELEEAVTTIRSFAGEDEEIPEEIEVGDAERFLGTQLLASALLTSDEFTARRGNFEAIASVDFVKLLFNNIGRSPSALDVVRGNTVIGGGEDAEGVGRLNYTTLFIGSGRFLGGTGDQTQEQADRGAVEIGVPGDLRERYRRASVYFALTGEVPDEAKVNRLVRGSRVDAVGLVFRSADFINRFDTFFGDVEEVGANEKISGWLGRYDDRFFDYGTHTGWIKHEEHGWWYLASGDTFWIFDDILDSWVWTHSGIYPFVYLDSEETWLYYDRGGSPSKRWFYFYNVDSWQSVEN